MYSSDTLGSIGTATQRTARLIFNSSREASSTAETAAVFEYEYVAEGYILWKC
jgi:hypothetical protein